MIYGLNKINEMAEGDSDFINSVIGVFLEEVPDDLKTLEAAVNSGDFQQIYQLSHKLKPNVDLLEMESTRALALEMETMGKNQEDLEGIRARFTRLKQDVDQAVVELKRDFDQ
ncbi:Hpt domain-containing protein [Robiginitalea aurantiaca]|uniref:Hpt domain-containing protein n=1 Tax=Robiginitalea aurantiaca TaxID=3056915 RepID=A0ABT7WGG7_9FLAO|nr:Hpt domain-containing protein [Robiginitalea aurantiaca]MDM9632017.1 Hpt domain-containing protein [Robiginitalea aurantiaca]